MGVVRERKKQCVLAALCIALACIGTSQAYQESGRKTYTNSIGMEFALIPAGSFLLGHHVMDEVQKKGHRPKVSISRPFYLGKYPVTQDQWEAVMGSNPAQFKGRNKPVENVSWNDVQEFIRRLNAREKHTRYRLPTEMEWEYAARGGTNSKYFFMEDPDSWAEAEIHLDAYAWFNKNSQGSTQPVGQKKPNPYGLYDMFGNVWEWVQDWFADLPKERKLAEYRGPESGLGRVLRGGSWDHDTRNAPWTNRIRAKQSHRSSYVGFRLALSPEAP